MALFTAILIPASTAISGFIASLGIVGTALTQLALGAALTFGTSLLAPKPRRFTNPAPTYQAVINQSTGPRRRGYGRDKLGGTRAFFESVDGRLYQIVMVHHGEVDAFESLWLGDTAVTTDGGGLVIAPAVFGDYVEMHTFSGSADQAASALMLADWPGTWSTDHRLRGVAYLLVVFRSPPSDKYLEVFPEGSNTPARTVARLSPVLDTRTGAMAWSDNPALCIADYLTHPDGYRRLTRDDLDTASWEAFANLCDESVPLAAGGSEPRYRLSGLYDLTDDPKDVLGRMRRTCDGELFTTSEGKLGIRGGAFEAPSVIVEDRDILFPHAMEEGAGSLDAFNQLKIVYTSPAHNYQTVEAQPWEDLSDQALNGVRSDDFTVDMCQSPSQARRLAKIQTAKSNPRWRGTIRVRSGMARRTREQRFIRLVFSELNIDESFLVLAHRYEIDGGILVGATLEVLSLGGAAYAWTTAEEGSSPPIAQDTRPDLTLEVPGAPTLRTEDRSGAIVVVGSVGEPERDDAEVDMQIRLDGSVAWEVLPVASGLREGVSGTLTGGSIYFVRARFRTAGAAGAWSAETSITAVYSASAPAAPTGFSATLDGAEVDLAWTSSAYRVRVYRAPGLAAVFADAVEIAEVNGVAYTDAPGAGAWSYFVKARNEGAVLSAATGPEDVTVS